MNKPIRPQYIVQDSNEKKEINNVSQMTMDQDQQEYEDQSGLISFANLEQKNKNQCKLVAGTDQNKYLRIGPGINLNGHCQNNVCKGKNGSWFCLGYGQFLINKVMTEGICRQCGSNIIAITVATVGFSRAIVQFSGSINQNGKSVGFNKTYEERKGQFIFFQGKQGASLENWFYLFAKCRKP